jgi:hypothetical protein
MIDRRILANYRVRPEILQRLLPAPFRPKLIHGWGMAGICLIRLRELRPKHLPALVGIRSENAAHRIAVEWDQDGHRREGVYVPRRESSSRFNTLVGGRIFPGTQHYSFFDVSETDSTFRIEIASKDQTLRVLIDAELATAVPAGSIFNSLKEASAFFEAGSIGYSPARNDGSFEGIELRSREWKVQPLNVRRIESSFFSNSTAFPTGSAAFDCALLMRGIAHEWHDRGIMAGTVAAG